MSAVAEAWINEPTSGETNESDRRRAERRLVSVDSPPQHRQLDSEAEASSSKWNVLAETLVEFPRLSCQAFLTDPPARQAGSAGHVEGIEKADRSYGEIWLEQERAKLRARTDRVWFGGPGATEGEDRLMRLAVSAPEAGAAAGPHSAPAAALGHSWTDDGPEMELRGALDEFFNPLAERSCRVTKVATLPRQHVAPPQSRGLRRLLPGVATLAVLAGLLAGASAVAHTRTTPTVVLAGSVKLASGQYAYTVRPGDTLWSIASRLEPTGDTQALVTRLEAQVHGDGIQPGQQIVVP